MLKRKTVEEITVEEINKGHYFEVNERIHCIQEMIQVLISDHPLVMQNPGYKALVDDAQRSLGKVYEQTGVELDD